MTITYQNAVDLIQTSIADSSDTNFVHACLDHAQQKVCRARRWPELMVDNTFFNTLAAYSTGTVAVTENSTTVTLTDGVWPTAVASSKYRFALGNSAPWYEVATRSSDTVILLKEAYIGDTATGSDYLVYQSHYDLATAVDRVEEMWLHDTSQPVALINASTDQEVTEFLHYPSGPGTPTHFYSSARTTRGTRRVQLGPETPDDVFRVEYTYRKKPTDGTFSGNLDESRWPVIVSRALALAYGPEFPSRAASEYMKYQFLLKEEWGEESETETQIIRIGDTRMRRPYTNHDRVFGRGTVKGPS